MIIAGPRPLHRVADLDRHRAGTEIITTLSDGNIRRRRVSENGKKQSEKGE